MQKQQQLKGISKRLSLSSFFKSDFDIFVIKVIP